MHGKQHSMAKQAADAYVMAAFEALEDIYPSYDRYEHTSPRVMVPDQFETCSSPPDQPAAERLLHPNLYIADSDTIIIGESGLESYYLGAIVGRAYHKRVHPSLWNDYTMTSAQLHALNEELMREYMAEAPPAFMTDDPLAAMENDSRSEHKERLRDFLNSCSIFISAVAHYSGLYLVDQWDAAVPETIRFAEEQRSFPSHAVGRTLFEDYQLSAFQSFVTTDLEAACKLIRDITQSDIDPD